MKEKIMRIIHGAPYARTNFVIWTMKELGLEYENIPVNPMRGETKTPEYMALNPNGLIPTLEEDGLVLWESTAINFYLAKKYGDGLLWATDPHEEAKIMQWCIFAATSVDKPAVDYILHKQALPKAMRDADRLLLAQQDLAPPLKVLESHLSNRDYMVGDRFTLADLTLAAILDYPLKSGFDFADYGNIKRWLARCLQRPLRVEMNG